MQGRAMWRLGTARSSPPVYCLFFVLIQLCTWKSITSDRTSINGLVFMENNQSTLPLMNNNLVLIIKNETDHNDIYYLQHKINQDMFTVRFHSGNITQIRKNGIYLLTLLIFGFTHRLLWEGIIVRQHLFTNHLNNITFIVRDVSNLPKCLLPGYPCLEGYGIPNQFISVCCSSTKCQSSITKQMTCDGSIPANYNVIITYILPRGIQSTIGLLNNKSVETTERMFQSISEACAIIKIVDATIHVESTNRSVFHNWFANRQFILQFQLSIVTSESHNQCLTKTLHSIQTHSLPFAIPLEDGSSVVVPIENASVNIADVAETAMPVEDMDEIIYSVPKVNWLLNGDAESGACEAGSGITHPLHWNYNGTITAILYNNTNGALLYTDPGPSDRGDCYFYGQRSDITSMWQIVNLPVFINLSLVDHQRIWYNLSAWIGGWSSQDDNAQISLVSLDQSNQQVGTTTTIGTVLAAERVYIPSLIFHETNGLVPGGTRSFLITVTITRVSGLNNDGAVDNIAFYLYYQ